MGALDKAIDDLRFRVIQLRLWAGEYVNAFQFLYRHEITQATVVGRRVATTPFDEDDANVIEFDLADGEYLVGVSGRGDGWIHALEVTTSVGRTFGVGGSSGFSFTCPVSPNEEVRGLSVRTRRDVAVEIDRLKPVCRRIPGVGEARELVIRAADALFATNIIAPQARRQLQQQYNQQFKAISAVMERGILYPVAAAVEFNAISKQVQAAFNSSVFSAILPTLFEEKEDQSTQAIADAQARLLTFDQWMRNAVGAELTVLSLRTATVWPMTKVHQVIDEGLRVRQYTAFVSLFVARPKALGDVFDARGKEIAGQLIDMDHGPSLRALIRARSHATGESVPDVLRALEPQPHALIERAVAAESVGVLAWLMTEGEIHPLGESLTPQDLVKNIGSAVARQTMLKMLAQIERRTTFSTASQALAHRDAPVQQSELLALVPSITSVYDLHVMLSHGLSSLRASEWKEVLVASCAFLTENDLVLDDAATKHLEFVLNEASRWGVFTRPECEALQFETTQAPVNAAAWTIELRSHLRQIQHYQNRTEAHVQCLDLNLRRLRDALDRRVDEVQTEKLVALVAMALAAAGGPLLRATREVAALAKPLNLLFEFASTDDDTVGAWLATQTTQLVLKDGELDLGDLIASLVSQTGAAEDPLADEREWGSLPSYTMRQSKPKLTKASSLPLELSGDEPEIGTPVVPSETIRASSRVVLDVAELESHVYHLAVAESGGDLERYKAYEMYFEPGDAARVNDLVDVSLDGGRTTTPMPAHEYASYLGYVAIVQHMLGHKDLAPREPKLTTLRRAYDYRTRESKWPR